MTPERRAQLEAAGHTVAESPDDWLGLDEADRQVNELRRVVAVAVRRLRDERGISQRELAERLRVAQSRVAGIEKAESASLDVILKAYLVLGGSYADFADPGSVEPEASNRKAPARRPSRVADPKAK